MDEIVKYKCYILTDSFGNIIDGWNNGRFPDKDTSKAIVVNETTDFNFSFYPGGRENPILFTPNGIPRYKYDEGQVRLLTQAESNIMTAIKEDKDLAILKSQLITDSKKQLQQYLSQHPLTWTDGKQYSVSQEKQALLTEQLALYTMDSDITLYWNASGEPSKPWPIDSLIQLAKAITEYVRPYVQYQQHKEVEINSAETADQARSIIIDYNQV